MTEPSREHVAPVAQIIESHLGGQVAFDPHSWRCYDKERYPGKCRCPADLAFDILTSTDPAVLDAMQDALVRAGRLTDEWGFGVPALDDQPGQYPAKSRQEAEGPHGRKFTHGNPVAVSRRLVTDWREES